MSGSEEVLETLKRIEEWLSIIAKTQLAPIAKSEFADQKMAKLYNMTGKASQTEIQKALKLSPNTISEAWKRWELQGLLIREGQRYRKVL
jgi:DNA-binding MarR family transcriptional regulator